MTNFTLKSDIYTLEDICVDRRQARNTISGATFSYSPKGSGASQAAPVIECTTAGARVVLSGSVKVGDTLNVKLESSLMELEGEARVAWSQTLSSSRHIAGLEFLSVRRRHA